MAYDETLALRVRRALASESGISEKKMFGGLAFLLNGNMCCGIVGDRLMVRVGGEGHEAALALLHVEPMDFTGRPMKGFVYVRPEGLASDKTFLEWIDRSVRFAVSLPAK